MGAISQYLVNHLVSFGLDDKDLRTVEETRSRFSQLAASGRLWSQQMMLAVRPDTIVLVDKDNQEVLDQFPVATVLRCDSILSEKRYPSLLLLVCQSAATKKPDVHFFSCGPIRAEQIRDDIIRAASENAIRDRPHPSDTLRYSQQSGSGMDIQDIPSPPYPHAPNPPPANPPPYPGIRANGVANGQPDKSFLRAQREVDILNHCFDDMEAFMGKLQQAAEAQTVLNQRNKKKKKSRKKNPEEDLLTAKAKPPQEAEFIDIFKKFKYCFSLLARLKSAITNPTSEELLHHVFKPLDMIVRATGGPVLAASVASPALTAGAVTLLQNNLTAPEKTLWTALGTTWTQAWSPTRGAAAPYTPVFLDGWKPEGSEVAGWEDPIMSQHRQDTERERQELQTPPQRVHPPSSAALKSADESDGMVPEKDRLYRCSYDFVARNSSELSVLQGEELEVVESSKRWWKCRNRFNEIGFVPFNILEPVSHIESPVSRRSPKPPAAPPMSKTFSYAPPSPPLLNPDPGALRPRSVALPTQHTPEETDRVMQVNDELLHRLTNGKAALARPLQIPRSADTALPLDYHSPPPEVEKWLRGKGFSEPTVQCLRVLTGAQLFSLNKEELRAVIPEEGARVYSQLTVQKALLEDARKATELEAVMEKQKMKVDHNMEIGTL